MGGPRHPLFDLDIAVDRCRTSVAPVQFIIFHSLKLV